MQRFHARLRDGDRVIYEGLSGYLEPGGGGGSGRFEVHQGGILGHDLAADRPYHLGLDDGRTWEIRLGQIHASDSSGIARFDFRLPADRS